MTYWLARHDCEQWTGNNDMIDSRPRNHFRVDLSGGKILYLRREFAQDKLF